MTRRFNRKRRLEQLDEKDVDEQDDGPPPARRRRLTTETPAIDLASVPSRRCSGCKRTVPLSNFPLKATGKTALQCDRCTARRVNRRPPRRDPEQIAPPHSDELDEQDADDQDDRPPPASPRQEAPAPEETPAVDLDSVPAQFCSGCTRKLSLCDFPTKNNEILLICVRCKVKQQNRRPRRRQTAPPQIGQENVAPPPVRRARRSRAQINAEHAAEERKRIANVEEAMAAAANARRIREQAEAARAAEDARRDTTAVASTAEAEVEAARRTRRAAADARKASRAAEDARRDATLRESMAAAARMAEANARQFREQAEAAWAASAAEYARRDAALRESMAATALASQETSRAASVDRKPVEKHPLSQESLDIRRYNAALSLTSCSLGHNMEVDLKSGVKVVQLHGELYRSKGPLIHPGEDSGLCPA
ncbi:hypothetical protein E4U52_001359 [Claviceps spartinae]|nr:hypothetical protein E4U52_001359 [Claviceps spartinae]